MVHRRQLCHSQRDGCHTHTDLVQHQVRSHPLTYLITDSCQRPHVALWVQYMVIYTILLGLIPSTWISVIWDQIIDPGFDLENIEQPENKIIKLFYKASGKINTSVVMRNVVFVLLGVMMMLSSVYDLILTPCMLENPRVSLAI